MLVALLGLGAWLLVPVLSDAAIQRKRETCLANLTRIGQALSTYLKEHDDRWPFAAKLRTGGVGEARGWPVLSDVLAGYLRDAPGVFQCPADVRRLDEDSPLSAQFSSRTTWYETEGTSYEWWWGEMRGGYARGQEPLTKAAGLGQGPADQWLLADFQPFHDGDGGGSINILFADLVARTSRPSRPTLE